MDQSHGNVVKDGTGRFRFLFLHSGWWYFSGRVMSAAAKKKRSRGECGIVLPLQRRLPRLE